MSTSLHVVFRVGDTHYAMPAADVVQMETYGGATPVPGAAPWIAGLVQIRGRVLPVVDLRARLGLPPVERTLDHRVIVVQRGDRTIGLLVDAAREVIRLAEEQVQPMPLAADHGGDLVRGIARTDHHLLMMFDVDPIVGRELIAHGHQELEPG